MRFRLQQQLGRKVMLGNAVLLRLMRTVTVCHAIPLIAKSNLGLQAYPYPLVLD